MSLTVDQLREYKERLAALRLPPFVIKDQAEADRMNREEEALGLSHVWKVGEAYYLLGGSGKIMPSPADWSAEDDEL